MARSIAHFLLQLGLLIGIFSTLAHVPMIYFQSRKRFRMNAVVLTAQALISFADILVIAWLNLWSVEAIIVATIIATAVSAIVFLYLVPRSALIDWAELREGPKHLARLHTAPLGPRPSQPLFSK